MLTKKSEEWLGKVLEETGVNVIQSMKEEKYCIEGKKPFSPRDKREG